MQLTNMQVETVIDLPEMRPGPQMVWLDVRLRVALSTEDDLQAAQEMDLSLSGLAWLVSALGGSFSMPSSAVRQQGNTERLHDGCLDMSTLAEGQGTTWVCGESCPRANNDALTEPTSVHLRPTDVHRLRRWMLEGGVNGPLTTETDRTTRLGAMGLQFFMDAGAMLVRLVPRA